MTGISFCYGSRLPEIFRSVSLDPTGGNRGKYAPVSCFGCPPSYAAVLGRGETLLETAPAEVESPEAYQDSFNGWVELWAEPGSLIFATTLPKLCVRIGKIDWLRPSLNA
jgi:hypothetical protein